MKKNINSYLIFSNSSCYHTQERWLDVLIVNDIDDYTVGSKHKHSEYSSYILSTKIQFESNLFNLFLKEFCCSKSYTLVLGSELSAKVIISSLIQIKYTIKSWLLINSRFKWFFTGLVGWQSSIGCHNFVIAYD